MKTFGAEFCVYEDPGFLAESVRRIYPLMDRILFLVGTEPWNGRGDPAIPSRTMLDIMGLPDPDRKVMVVSNYWKTEAEQRNHGLALLRDLGCSWCLTIDDDEMWNREELRRGMERISAAPDDVAAFCVPHLIYWRRRDLAIPTPTAAMPVFVATRKDDVVFTEARCFSTWRRWESFDASDLLCHHLSYVRTDEQMRRKLKFFSHAATIPPDWFERVWLGWHSGMTDLHPSPTPETFPTAVPVSRLPWRLEPLPATP